MDDGASDEDVSSGDESEGEDFEAAMTGRRWDAAGGEDDEDDDGRGGARSHAKEDDNDGDDMFAEEDRDVDKKRGRGKTLRAQDIEGQEEGPEDGHLYTQVRGVLDDDKEVGEDGDGTGETKEIKLEPFNLRMEMEEGYVDTIQASHSSIG